jgi:hypothetical protein
MQAIAAQSNNAKPNHWLFRWAYTAAPGGNATMSAPAAESATAAINANTIPRRSCTVKVAAHRRQMYSERRAIAVHRVSLTMMAVHRAGPPQLHTRSAGPAGLVGEGAFTTGLSVYARAFRRALAKKNTLGNMAGSKRKANNLSTQICLWGNKMTLARQVWHSNSKVHVSVSMPKTR